MKKVVKGDGCNLSRRHGGRGQRDGKSAYNSHYLDERADSEGRDSLHTHLVTSLYMLSQPLAVYKTIFLHYSIIEPNPQIQQSQPQERATPKKPPRTHAFNAPSPPKSSQPSSPNPPLSPVSHSRNTLQRSWHQSLHANRAGSSDLSKYSIRSVTRREGTRARYTYRGYHIASKWESRSSQ